MDRKHLPEKAVVVALDHAQAYGVIEGLEDPGKVLDVVVEAGADGILASYGVVKKYRNRILGQVPLFMRLDGGPSMYREDWLKYTEWSLLHSVEDAQNFGVDGVCVMCFLGAEVELRTFEIVARVASECGVTGLPLMVEALPCLDLQRIPQPLSPDAMASAARIAFEHGADILKTYYTGTPEGFRRVTRNCPVPTLIGGGPKMDTERAALEVVHGAMQGGAKGVVFGRNIWQSRNVQGAITALRAIIHSGVSVDQALREFEQ